MAKPIHFFSKNDPYFELSNFAPLGLEVDGKYWPTVEHYFQAAKFSGPENAEYRERIRRCGTPKDAKTLGRTRKVAIRADWDEARDEVMLFALRLKFSSPKAQAVLLRTKRRPLVEASPYDRYWGCGADGKGKNRLGKLLMQVRTELVGGG